MKTISLLLAIILVIGVIMFILNPTQDNLNTYLEKRSNSNIKEYSEGSRDRINRIEDNQNSSSPTYSANMFDRKDYYIFSIYKGRLSSDAKSVKYLGMFRIFFKIE